MDKYWESHKEIIKHMIKNGADINSFVVLTDEQKQQILQEIENEKESN